MNDFMVSYQNIPGGVCGKCGNQSHNGIRRLRPIGRPHADFTRKDCQVLLAELKELQKAHRVTE